MRRIWLALALALLMPQEVPVEAETAPSKLEQEIQAAWTAASKVAIAGPGEIKLLDQATLKLSSDQVFIPAEEANRVMTALGNQALPSRFGLIASKKENWLVDIDWTKEGYIRDGDAKEWKPDSLLENLKEGTEQGNASRIARGIPALDVVGWVETPTYDAATHRLIWSLSLRERGAPANIPQTINYNTYALGREGYFSLDLVTGSDTIAADKNVAKALLASLDFKPGKRYQDFNGSTDKVAAYGLGALIGVVAAKKLGLLTIIGIFLLKAWKIGLLAVAGGVAAAKRFFKRGGDPDLNA